VDEQRSKDEIAARTKKKNKQLVEVAIAVDFFY